MTMKALRRLRALQLYLGINLSAAVLSLPSHAADIAWDEAQNTINKSDLIEGRIIHALNGGEPLTVNNGGSSGATSYNFAATQYSGLTFTPAITSAIFTGATNGAASTGDAQFDSLLNSLTHTTSGTILGTQTIEGLSIGSIYQVQVFFNDQRSASSNRKMIFGDGANTITLSGASGNFGQYAIGTFTADATTQSLTHATDGFGNIHFNAILVTETSSRPLATLTNAEPTVSAPFEVTITFSEPVTGLEEADFLITNGSVQSSSLSGSGTDWAVTIVPSSNGDVSVHLPADSVTDIDGDANSNSESEALVITFISPGSDQPVPTLSTTNPLVSDPYTVDVVFSEPVTGLSIDDFLVTNATLSNLSGSGSSYSLLATPVDTGEITLSLPEKSVTDLDGDVLMNSASNQLITLKPEQLTVAIYGPTTTDTPEFDIHLTFSNGVAGLDTSDFLVSNAVVLSVQEQGRREFAKRYFVVKLRANAPGQVELRIPAGNVISDQSPQLTNQASASYSIQCTSDFPRIWSIDDQASWIAHQQSTTNMTVADGFAEPTANQSQYTSTTKTFAVKRKARSLTFEQSPVWDNWIDSASNIGPSGAGDAPILLPVADGDYYFLGRGNTGGYHAWHSVNMKDWVHHGPITTPTHRWVTTAEYKDNQFYIYVDHPNDHTPHLYIDDDLKDGKIGTFMGMVFNDPTHGSDCSIFRDNSDGRFHLIHEDWSPINASTHAWDSPLAGHTSSEDGITGFEPAEHVPPVDERTNPTGVMSTYSHPHVAGTPFAGPLEYEVHEPAQNAYGDWTTIKIGSRYYLFGDYEPDNGSAIRAARFTSESIYEQFEFAGELGSGHPDPTVGFAEGQFYLIRQQATDHISPGPWVDGVEARAGVDTDGDGNVDVWTDWQGVSETYAHTPGYARVVTKTPAQLDLTALPEGFGFAFEFRVDNSVVPNTSPIMDRVSMNFEPTHFQKWANERGISTEIEADHNGNQIPNILEFSTGVTSTKQLIPDADWQISFSVTNEAILDGISVILQYSTDLNMWHDADLTSEIVKKMPPVSETNGKTNMKFQVTNNGADKVFVRLKVVLQPDN